MKRHLPLIQHWHKTPLALAVCAALLPAGTAWSIDLVQAPPSTVQP